MEELKKYYSEVHDKYQDILNNNSNLESEIYDLRIRNIDLSKLLKKRITKGDNYFKEQNYLLKQENEKLKEKIYLINGDRDRLCYSNKKLHEENKKLDEENKKLDEENKKLDEVNKKYNERFNDQLLEITTK